MPATKQRRERVQVTTTYLPADYKVPDEMTVGWEEGDKMEVLCPPPDPARADWIDFLHYMADFGEPAKEIISIVEKPWKWTPEYAEYLLVGGVER